MELDTIDLQILNALTFPEPFSLIVEEVNAPVSIIGDSLKTLMVKDLVKPLTENKETNRWEKGFFYNSDNMHEYQYQITSKGLDLLF